MTVDSPSIGSLSSYGAYDSASPGVVAFEAPSVEDWEIAGEPSTTSFTYRLNDGTSFSATKTVTINFLLS